jgi:hypothetical protein
MLVAACAGDDFSRPGTWQAIGVNDANLHAMLADPTHAVRGAAAGSERGQPGSVAIHRLEQGRRPPLPDTRVSRVGATGAAPAGGANAR